MRIAKTHKHQPLPTLTALAARRGQTIGEILVEWYVEDVEQLRRRCQLEGLAAPSDDEVSYLPASSKAAPSASVGSPTKMSPGQPKRTKKGRFTSDASAAGKHGDVPNVDIDETVDVENQPGRPGLPDGSPV